MDKNYRIQIKTYDEFPMKYFDQANSVSAPVEKEPIGHNTPESRLRKIINKESI